MILPQTIQEVIAQLETIVKECKQENKRMGYFASLYLRVTKEVSKKITERYFDDNERMEKLDVVFANRYLAAYYQYKQKQSCSSCWQIAFDASHSWTPLVIQHLLSGMNAHIGLDLGIAAASICSGTSIHTLQNDFNKINSLLSSLIDTIQNELSEMWTVLKFIDWIAGKMDEEMAAFSMELARDAAWKVALQYALFKTNEEQNNFIKGRDASVCNFGKKIIQPGITLSILIKCLKIFERGSINKKIEILNQHQ